MAKRGALYRCHLFSYGGPQTEGVEARWTRGLEPVGDTVVNNGELIELFVTVTDLDPPPDTDTPIRFDVLEEDFILSGGSDDRVASILGTVNSPSSETFPVIERRTTLAWSLGEADTPEDAIAQFIEANPDDYDQYLLLLTDPAESDVVYVVTWWRAPFVDDAAGNAELYFVVSLGPDTESQAEAVLNVRKKVADVVVPSGFADPIAMDEQIDAANDDEPLDPDDAELPPSTEFATDEPDFRLAAADIVRTSGVLESAGAERPSEPVVDLVLIGPPEPGVPAQVPGTEAPLDGGLTFPPLEISIGPQEHPLEPPSEEKSDPYGTGWPYDHWSDTVDQDKPVATPSGFNKQTLAILSDWRTLTTNEDVGHVQAFSLKRAIRWGRTLYNRRGFALIEAPIHAPGVSWGADPPRYFVCPLAEPVAMSDLEGQPVPGADGTSRFVEVDVRYQQLDPPNKERAWTGYLRAIGTTDDRLLWPRVGFFERELFRQLDDEEDEDPGTNPELKARLIEAAFAPIDAAKAAGEDEKAKDLLVHLDHNAFSLLTREQRAIHLETLIGQLGLLDDEEIDKTISEILRAVQNSDELIWMRNRLGPERLFRMIERMGSQLWPMLSSLGKRFEAELPPRPFNLEEFLKLMHLILSGTDVPDKGIALRFAVVRVSVGPGGFQFSADFLSDVRQATIALIRFIPNLLKDIINLATKPKQLIDAAEQLMKFAAMLEIARIPPQVIPAPTPGEPKWVTAARNEREKAIKTLKETFDGIVKAFLAGYRAAELLTESQEKGFREKLLTRIRWALILEILTMLIGVGEVKAALTLARGAIEAVSLSRIAAKLGQAERGMELFRIFSRALSRESRFMATEEEAARALSRLSRTELEAGERALTKVEAKSGQTLQQMTAADAEAAKALVSLKQQAESMALLSRKASGAGAEAIERVFGRMRQYGGMTEAELHALIEGLSDEVAPRFVAAVDALAEEGLADAARYGRKGFYKDLADHPSWMNTIRNGNERAFANAYSHAGGDARKVDAMVAGLADVGKEAKYEANVAKAVVQDIEKGEPAALNKLAQHEPPPPVKPKEPGGSASAGGGGEPPGGPPGAGGPTEPPKKPAGAAEVEDLFNRDAAFYESMAPLHDAVDTAVAAERGNFRGVVTSLSDKAFEKRKAKLLERLGLNNLPESEVKKVDEALKALNAEFKNRASKAAAPLTDKVIADRLGGLRKYQNSARLRVRELQQRIKEYGRRARNSAFPQDVRDRAAKRVQALKSEQNQLKAWIKNGDARRAELKELAEAVAKSPFLKDRLAHGGDSTLYRLWADMKFRPSGRKAVKSTFEDYAARRIGAELRGLSGEVDGAFQLGPQFDLLKAPDRFVTRTGTDLIAQRKLDKVLAILDNKSAASKLIKDVSALTRNLVGNLREDIIELRALARRTPEMSKDLVEATNRMERVANRMEGILAGVPAGAELSVEQQAQIAKVLRDEKIQFLVTNFGGKSEALAPDLAKHLQFWDVSKPGALPPMPGPL